MLCGRFRVNGRISSQRLKEIREISGKFGINMGTVILKQNFGIKHLYLTFVIGPLKIKVYEQYMTSRNKWMNNHQPYYLYAKCTMK
jgi:hypothetical protein